MTENDLQRLSRIKPKLERRARINKLTRAFFQQQGFLEVETPVRVPVVAPEQYIVPVSSEDWLLSTSPELHMKRLLCAGYEKLFQFSHCFRRGERGKQHNPEFTMLEWYRAGADYMQMAADTENLVLFIARGLGFNQVIPYQGKQIILTSPWQKISVRDAYLRHAGWDPAADPDPLRFDTDFITRVLPGFASDRPTVLYDYPSPMASLARLKPGEPGVAERTEIFIGGLELANAYSELRDAGEQEKRFRQEITEIERERGQKSKMPWRFLEALPCLPDCGGIALGVDRLVMLFCDTDSIDDVMAFTSDWA